MSRIRAKSSAPVDFALTWFTSEDFAQLWLLDVAGGNFPSSQFSEAEWSVKRNARLDADLLFSGVVTLSTVTIDGREVTAVNVSNGQDRDLPAGVYWHELVLTDLLGNRKTYIFGTLTRFEGLNV
jgi:hypothetical protein